MPLHLPVYYIKAFYHYLNYRYKIHNIIDNIPPPRRSVKYPPTLSHSELQRLINSVKDDEVKTAILFLIDTGARAGELSSLSIDKLKEVEYGYIALINGKTGERFLPISYITYHALMVNLPFKHSNQQLRRMITRAFNDANMQGSALTLRHTFATLWEGDELALQSIMGHANLSTTKIYRHLRIKTLAEQHHKYSPLATALNMSQSML